MYITLLLASLFMLFTTLAPHLPGKHWLIRVWEFPRLQLCVLILLCMTGWFFMTMTHPVAAVVMIMALALAGIYQAIWILPYTALWPKQVNQVSKVDDNCTLSILTSNVYMYNDNYEGLKTLVRQYQPAMLILLESNQAWQDAMSSIHSDYPHRLACPLENLYGMHLYSKLPFKGEQIRYIVEDDVPSMEVQIDISGTQVTVYFLHPKPPSPTENESAAPRDTELAIIGKEMAEHKEPVIVSGDLNDVAWSPSTRRFRKLSKAQDPRVGRGFYNTFHARYPMVRWPLDHIFHSRDFELVRVERLPGYGSDHFPLFTQLQLIKKR